MKNDLLLNESEMQERIENAILNAFKSGLSGQTDYFYNLFGKREFTFYNSVHEANSQGSSPKFPCAVLTLSSTPLDRTITSCQVERFSEVELELEHYNVAVGDRDKERIGQIVNFVIKKTLQQEFGIVLNSNIAVLSPDSKIYRRSMRGIFIYDNLNNIFGKGD